MSCAIDRGGNVEYSQDPLSRRTSFSYTATGQQGVETGTQLVVDGKNKGGVETRTQLVVDEITLVKGK